MSGHGGGRFDDETRTLDGLVWAGCERGIVRRGGYIDRGSGLYDDSRQGIAPEFPGLALVGTVGFSRVLCVSPASFFSLTGIGMRTATSIGCFTLLALLCGSANAQMYSYDPANPPGSAHVYFGSTKDSDGNFLSGVTVQLDAGNISFVMVTDEAGRFKIEVPQDLLPSNVKFSCSKPGYVQRRAVTRFPPNHALSPVQADCVLEPKSAVTR